MEGLQVLTQYAYLTPSAFVATRRTEERTSMVYADFRYPTP